MRTPSEPPQNPHGTSPQSRFSWTFENVEKCRSRDSALLPKNAEETPGNLEGCEANERPLQDRHLDPPLELYCW